ncbi:four-helix bundle copper-binding protein [Cronbergia sp. UHCC 0137]|uniref:four-helix bundle copper-binding protein n=1 Tax=Cronbergia sp. UHCC 0137 TaxID=3110239 RepID=UPI002B219031|nr:four-helix bundle copper-binding protein [Cronbergia sp. UHCC 0137]MEA5616239.1 four-helix bundle copper-binding protein [Cronbergia sp. UHCC 0137]
MAIQQINLQQVNQQIQQCIENCLDCHSICLNTVTTYCIHQGGMHIEPAHIRLMLDCAEICQTSANFMLRGSELHLRSCAMCAEVCDRCAQNCDRFSDDHQMRVCADICHRCAESCRQFSLVAA